METINTFVQERCIYAVGENDDGTAAWFTRQVKNLSIACDGETVSKTDANGSTIFTIQRAKTCEVTFDTPMIDLNLIAAMNGTTKTEASALNPLIIPKMEIIPITADNLTAVVLESSVVNSGTAGNPVYKIMAATLTKDGSVDTQFAQGSSASSNVYTYTSGTKTLTFADGTLSVGDKLLVSYDYSSTSGVQIVNSADDFPKASRVKLLIQGYDVCDQSTVRYMWIILPNAKFTTNYTIDMELESDISCTLECAYDYCSDDRELYRIVMAE